MLCLRTTRVRAVCVAALALGGATALAHTSVAGSGGARATASAYAVHISVPGAQASGTLTSPAGSYQYRDLVSVTGYTAGSAISGARAYAHSELTGISLLAGLVTADGITAQSFADGRASPATGTFGGSVANLAVAGTAVSVPPGGRFDIPGIGWGTLEERRVARSDGSYRGSEAGLHIQLTSDWHDVPAGTEIVLGYTEATTGAAGSAGSRATGIPSAAAGERGGAATSDTTQLNAPVVTLPASDGTPTDSGGQTPRGIAALPPGGFTLTPPIDEARSKALTGPGYDFPVAGGAHYGHDFGHFSAGSGFHEGSDLFAPPGTPVVAVQSGVLRNVGWDRLGGWRLWLADSTGNWFYYAHLSAYSSIASDGARVRRGDALGYVGTTGDATGEPAHLHFEIHPAGKWAVPPYDYLQAWQGYHNPLPAVPAALPQPALAASRLASTDVSAASGLDTAAVLAHARGKRGDGGFIALGAPAPGAAELLAGPSTP
jgi:murein DD-endopeptidase MepM/ murein hydrolase activator NlpD